MTVYGQFAVTANTSGAHPLAPCTSVRRVAAQTDERLYRALTPVPRTNGYRSQHPDPFVRHPAVSPVHIRSPFHGPNRRTAVPRTNACTAHERLPLLSTRIRSPSAQPLVPCTSVRHFTAQTDERLYRALTPVPRQHHPACCRRQRIPASTKSSISPSRTAVVFPVSCSVRRSLTIWYGCST